MTEIYGNFVEREYVKDSCADHEFLMIIFSPSSIPLQDRWRNNGLSADFLADYLSSFFPGEDDESLHRRSEIKAGVNYIANELLEKAMKFNYAPIKHSVSIVMELQKNKVVFYVSNCVNPSMSKAFRNQIQELLNNDPNDLYMEKLMANEEDEDTSGSGLVGYLTMLNDWKANLAWKFEDLEESAEVQKVTVMVQFAFA